jgi:hypothetical protein
MQQHLAVDGCFVQAKEKEIQCKKGQYTNYPECPVVKFDQYFPKKAKSLNQW